MTSTKIDLKQREHLETLVEHAKSSEKKQLEEQSGADKESILNAIAKSRGVESYLVEDADLRKKIRALEDGRRENEQALEELGFDYDNGHLSLRWNAPTDLIDELAKRTLEARRPIEKSLKKYDLAITRIWSAMSGEELQKAVEGLL